MIEPTPLEWITVKTTLPATPLPLMENRPEIVTDRLILRPLVESDLESWHAIRIQPEVMQWTGQGSPDPDLAWSKDRLQSKVAPQGNNTYDFAVCLADTGEMIGIAGSHIVVGELGWPALGYMLRREAWGRGYATELVHAFLSAWWALPRAEVDVKVERGTVRAGEDGRAMECIVAVTLDRNVPSQRVLEKANMELVKAWKEEDKREKGGTALLYGYIARRG